MNRHFPVVNKRGLLTSCSLLLIAILLFSLSLSKRISSGSIIWLLPVIAAVIVFIFAIMILISVITAGIDVKNGQVVFADATGGAKTPQFDLKDLKNIELHNADGVIEDPKTANLVGARIVFFPKLGGPKTYYPIQITYKQYESIRMPMMEMAKEARKEDGKAQPKKSKKVKKLK